MTGPLRETTSDAAHERLPDGIICHIREVSPSQADFPLTIFFFALSQGSIAFVSLIPFHDEATSFSRAHSIQRKKKKGNREKPPFLLFFLPPLVEGGGGEVLPFGHQEYPKDVTALGQRSHRSQVSKSSYGNSNFPFLFVAIILIWDPSFWFCRCIYASLD